MRFNGFHPTRADYQLQWYGIADQVVFKKGDAGQIDVNGGVKLGVDGGLSASTFAGICALGGGSAVAGENASKLLPFFVPTSSQVFWVKNGSVTAAAISDVGEIIDLQSENTVDVTDVTTGGVGLKVMAVDTTNDYVKGVFAGL
jgi:hypothetical protein